MPEDWFLWLAQNWRGLAMLLSAAISILLTVIMFRPVPPSAQKRRRLTTLLLAANGILLGILIYWYRPLAERSLTAPALPPEYKWPPPKPSDTLVIVPEWFNAPDRRVGKPYHPSINGAYDYIRRRIYEAGFRKVGVYSLALNGFMFVTEPERVRPDGLPAENRWQMERQEGSPDFLSRIRNSFDSAPEGNYRFFIIAVTAGPPVIDGEGNVDWRRDSRLAHEGDYPFFASNDYPLTPHHRLHVYLYHFHRDQLERFPHSEQSRVDLVSHLRAAKLEDLIKP